MTLAQIGKKEPATTFVGMLLECHQRIRTFSAMACRLADAKEASDEEVSDAARAVVRYFSEALPLHVEDEEQTLLPRLRGKDAAVDEALDRMSVEHTAHEPALSSLLTICERLVTAPAELPALRDELGSSATALEAELGAHLDHEEATILPAVERWLSADEQAAMIAELRTRRS
jgi:hemerythrin-like domain-containing protein